MSAFSTSPSLTRRPGIPVFRRISIGREKAPFDGARLFQKFCLFTPILWGLGVLTVSALLLVLKLLWERWPRGVAINVVVGAWLIIPFVQASASIFHSIAVGNFLGELHNLVSFAVVGWIFGAFIIAAGSAHRLATERTVRAVTWLGTYMLILEIISVPLRLAGFTPAGFQMTPLGMLLPNSPSARFYTSVVLFMSEDTFGEKAMRLILFFPWYTALGLGAVSIVLISTLERNLKWRLVSMLGGIIAAIFSWSRIAIFCLVAVGGLMIFVKLPRLLQIMMIAASLAVAYGAIVNGFDPIAEYDRLQHDVDEVRPGSNMARDLIYSKSWAGFVQSPYYGNGLNFPQAIKTQPTPIGSHSSTYGLLYTAGAPGLAAFLLAMIVTTVALIARYLTLPPASMERRVTEIGIGMIICLALYCPFEAIYSLTLPCIVLFAWIGACLPSTPSTPRLGRRLTSSPGPVFAEAAPSRALQPLSRAGGARFLRAFSSRVSGGS